MEYSVHDKKSRKHFISWYLKEYKPLGERRQAMFSRRMESTLQKKRAGALCTPLPLDFLESCLPLKISKPIISKDKVKPRFFKRSNALYGAFSLYTIRRMGVEHQLKASEITEDVGKIMERLLKVK